MSSSRCAPFWVESPRILWDDAFDFFPFHEQAQVCTSTALNSLTRFGIYLAAILSIFYGSTSYMGIAFGIAILAAAAYYGMKDKDALREGFDGGGSDTTIVTPTLVRSVINTIPKIVGGRDVADKPIADVIGVTDRTLPTGPNPFMNMLVDEIGTNPNKAPATNTDTAEIARTWSDQFQTRVYGDSTDVFQHNQNQRVWLTQPSTSIPNDQESFANWLYRVPGKTCKEGNMSVCRSATEGGTVTFLSAN